ncbi:MAG: crossover junction endodeoxyribonuclease RuvC [bacterium]|nr:crossover junction endodeoxyribonuclease RuvC [bacterium]
MTDPTTIQHIPLRILAINPGTHNMGYAVLDAGELLYNRVHTFTRRKTGLSTLAEGRRFVNALIEAFNPTVFVIENAFHTQAERSSLLHALVDEITRVAGQRGLKVFPYTPATVKKAITGVETASTRKVAETIVRLWYHRLGEYLHTDAPEQDTYWENMFDAVALGVVAHYEVTGQKLPHPLVTASEL